MQQVRVRLGVVLKFRSKLKWHQLFIKGKFVAANMHSYLNDNNTSNDDFLFIHYLKFKINLIYFY